MSSMAQLQNESNYNAVLNRLRADLDRLAISQGYQGGQGYGQGYYGYCCNPLAYNQQPDRAFYGGEGVGQILNNNERFSIRLSVYPFRIDEIRVDLLAASGKDNKAMIRVKAEHEDRADAFGSIRRSFTRQYELPADVNGESLRSSLSADGVLSLEADKRGAEKGEERQARAIPIQAGGALLQGQGQGQGGQAGGQGGASCAPQ